MTSETSFTTSQQERQYSREESQEQHYPFLNGPISLLDLDCYGINADIAEDSFYLLAFKVTRHRNSAGEVYNQESSEIKNAIFHKTLKISSSNYRISHDLTINYLTLKATIS